MNTAVSRRRAIASALACLLVAGRVDRARADNAQRLKDLVRKAGLILWGEPSLIEDFSWTEIRTGKRLSVRKDLHGKVVLINIWATWCPPCRREIVDLEGLYQRYQSRGFTVLGVGSEARALQREYLDVLGATYPAVTGPTGKLAFFRRTWYPSSFLLDREGRLVGEKQGVPNWNGAEMGELVDHLLASA